MTTDLSETIADASRGDRRALESLMERFFPELRAFVRLQIGPMVAQKESAADVVQSAFRYALERLDTFEFRSEGAFRRWLMIACTNKLRDHEKHWFRQQRDVRRERPLQDSVLDHVAEIATPSGEVIRREELGRLEQALDRLPDDYRRAVTMSRLLGMSPAEIASELGRTEGATRVLVHRAVARLGLELSTIAGTDSDEA